jgi:hypothetical protein
MFQFRKLRLKFELPVIYPKWYPQYRFMRY